ELSNGMRQMKEDGFYVDHLQFSDEIHTYQERLLNAITSLETIGPEEAKSVIKEIEERLAEMYDSLEKEALAKNYVESKATSFSQVIHKMTEQFENTKSEVEQLREAYYFEDEDLEKYMEIEKVMTQLIKEETDLTAKIKSNSYAHSVLRDQLENALYELEEIEEEHEQFKDQIQGLRK